MFPTVQPPTDNLYKFTAIAGLVVLLLSVWYSLDQLDKAWAQRVRLETEMKLLSNDLASLQREFDASDWGTPELEASGQKLNKAREAVSQLERKGESAPTEIAEISKELDEIGRTIRTVNERNREPIAAIYQRLLPLNVKIIELGGKVAELDLVANQARRWRRIGVGGSAIGLVAILFGFTLWYRRLQRYQDRVAKSDSESRTMRSE